MNTPEPPPQRPLPPPPLPAPDDSSQPWSMLCHLTAFGGLFVPLGNIWGPLIVWLMKRDQSPEVDAHGKASLNFQISMTIYLVICFFLSFFLIGIPLLIAGSIVWVVVVIIASTRANAGELYNYPLAIRFIN